MILAMRPTVLLSVLICTGILVAFNVLALPALAALPLDHESWQRAVAPLLAGIAATTVFLLRKRALYNSERPTDLLHLPVQITLAFVLVGAVGLPLGALVAEAPLLVQRPSALLLGGPALTIAVGLLLYTLLHPKLVVEAGQLLARRAPPAKRRFEWWGAISLRRALFLTTVALASVALVLSAVHSRSQLRSIEEVQQATHLQALKQAVRAQLAGLPPARYPAYFRDFPGPVAQGMPMILDQHGRTLYAVPGYQDKTLQNTARGCRLAGHGWVCLFSSLSGGRQLVLLARDALPLAAGGGAALLAGGILVLAAVLGLLIGRDAARDLDHVTSELRAMAAHDRVDLARGVPVASLDEVGELVAAVGRLRGRLAADMRTYSDSLERARAAELVKNQFISDVSHELRTPLNNLCGYAQLLLEGIEGELTPAQHDDVEVIYKGSKQLLGLINDVLDMSVMESGRLNLVLEEIVLEPLLKELLDQQQSLVRSGRSKVQLLSEVAEDLPTLRADPARLRQILQNLLSNALKFTRRGEVWLRVRPVGEELVFEVEDTGPGISAIDLPSIFEEYRQAGTVRARRGGTGLGLAICKRLVQLHDGRVEVSSEVGRGSRFSVYLPAAGPRERGSA